MTRVESLLGLSVLSEDRIIKLKLELSLNSWTLLFSIHMHVSAVNTPCVDPCDEIYSPLSKNTFKLFQVVHYLSTETALDVW